MNLDSYPDRMFENEVLKVARYGKTILEQKQKEGIMPRPYEVNGKRRVYLKSEVAKGLGLSSNVKSEDDPIMRGIDKLGYP